MWPRLSDSEAITNSPALLEAGELRFVFARAAAAAIISTQAASVASCTFTSWTGELELKPTQPTLRISELGAQPGHARVRFSPARVESGGHSTVPSQRPGHLKLHMLCTCCTNARSKQRTMRAGGKTRPAPDTARHGERGSQQKCHNVLQ